MEHETRPSKNTSDHWIYSTNKTNMNNRKPGANCGKWLVFAAIAEIDGVWEKIKTGTETGQLGFASKVSTMRPNELAGPPGYSENKVVCAYTYDWQDEADVMRVREALRSLGFKQKLPYKTDADTLAGNYVHRGKKRVSKYYV